MVSKTEYIIVFRILGFSKSIIVLLKVSLIKFNKIYNFERPNFNLIKFLSAPFNDFTLKPLLISSSV